MSSGMPSPPAVHDRGEPGHQRRRATGAEKIRRPTASPRQPVAITAVPYSTRSRAVRRTAGREDGDRAVGHDLGHPVDRQGDGGLHHVGAQVGGDVGQRARAGPGRAGRRSGGRAGRPSRSAACPTSSQERATAPRSASCCGLGVRADVHVDADRVGAEPQRLLDLGDQHLGVDVGGAGGAGAQVHDEGAAARGCPARGPGAALVDDDPVGPAGHQRTAAGRPTCRRARSGRRTRCGRAVRAGAGRHPPAKVFSSVIACQFSAWVMRLPSPEAAFKKAEPRHPVAVSMSEKRWS